MFIILCELELWQILWSTFPSYALDLNIQLLCLSNPCLQCRYPSWCCCCCCMVYRSAASICILITASICICLTSGAVTSTSVSSTKPADAGLTPVAGKPGADASAAGRRDGTAKTDSVAAGGADDVTLSKAVSQFYSDKGQDSGAVKVFTSYLPL